MATLTQADLVSKRDASGDDVRSHESLSTESYSLRMEFHRQSELFDLLDRLQSARLDDQRCELPSSSSAAAASSNGGLASQVNSNRQLASKQMLQRMLKHPPPYPMVALVHQGAHWVEPSEDGGRSSRPVSRVTCGPTMEEDTAKMYRVHFCGFEHFNFCASDPTIGQ